MSESEADWRVAKLQKMLTEKENELQMYITHKRIQDHDVH